MKKLVILTLLLFLASGIYMGASARTQYDSTGRHIIYNDTIRGRKQAAYEQTRQVQQNRIQAAAAAKVDYENESKAAVESQKPKSNYYHSSEKFKNRNTMPTNTIRGRKQAAYERAIQNKTKAAPETAKADNAVKADNNIEPKTLNNKPESEETSVQEPKEAPVQEIEKAEEIEETETAEKAE